MTSFLAEKVKGKQAEREQLADAVERFKAGGGVPVVLTPHNKPATPKYKGKSHKQQNDERRARLGIPPGVPTIKAVHDRWLAGESGK